MTRNKKIILSVGIPVGAIIIGLVVAYVADGVLHHQPSASTPTSTTNITIPATTDEQNKKADTAFTAALAAMNKGDTTEAKKQLDIALALYQAAHNENGIANVNAQYSILNAAPKKPSHPNIVTN